MTTFLVTAPRSREIERRYVLDVVLERWLGCDYELRDQNAPTVSIVLASDPTGRTLTIPDRFLSMPDERWLTGSSLPAAPLPRSLVPEMLRGDVAGPDIAVLFGGIDPAAPLITESADGIDLAIDVFGAIFFLLSRYEEAVMGTRDPHGRVPSTASVLGASGYLQRPLADEYAALLWVAMRRLWPQLQRRPAEYRLNLTHDLDQPWAVIGQPARSVVKSLAADVLRRRDPRLVLRRLRAAVASPAAARRLDPFARIEMFMDTAERNNTIATFYIHSGGSPGDFDFRYDTTDGLVAPLVRRIHDRGHELGLHTSYGSHLQASQTRHEFESLVRSCKSFGFQQAAWGVRQHYLRFEVPETWRIQDAAGLAHDSSLGFYDQIGFRAGTCRRFPVFDVRERRALRIEERPLLVMDTTLFHYMQLGFEEAGDRVRALVVECRRHGGEAVILYHNNTLPGVLFERHYPELVDGLAA